MKMIEGITKKEILDIDDITNNLYLYLNINDLNIINLWEKVISKMKLWEKYIEEFSEYQELLRNYRDKLEKKDFDSQIIVSFLSIIIYFKWWKKDIAKEELMDFSYIKKSWEIEKIFISLEKIISNEDSLVLCEIKGRVDNIL